MRKKNTKKEILDSPSIGKKEREEILRKEEREVKSQEGKSTIEIAVAEVADSLRQFANITNSNQSPPPLPKYASLLEITPAMMSRVTGYSEATCKQVLYDYYPNKETTEFINQQMTIFFNRIKNVLYNVELWAAIDVALESGKVRSAEQIRLLVELQNINQILNTDKYS